MEFYDHRGGLNTREAPYLLDETEFSDCQNIVLDEQGKVKTRKGMSNYKTIPSVSGLVEINDCDATTGWTVDVPGTLSVDTTNKYEGTGSLRNTRPIGEIISDCESTTNWAGQTGRDASNKYSGTYSLYKNLALGEVVDNCDSTSGWTGPTLETSIKYEGTGSLRLARDNYKSISKNYSGLRSDALFTFYAYVGASINYHISIQLETNSTNYYYANVSVSGGSSWNTYSVRKGDFTAVGSPSWANITRLRIIVINYTYLNLYPLYIDYIHWVEKGRDNLELTYDPGTWDWSHLESDTDFQMYVKMFPGLSSATWKVRFYDGSAYYEKSFNLSTTTSWQSVCAAKGDFTASGSPDWASIDSMKLYLTFTLSSYTLGTKTYYWDQIRWEEKTLADVWTLDWTSYPKDWSSLSDTATFSLWFRYHDPGYLSAARIEVRFYTGTYYYYKNISIDINKRDSFQKLACNKSDFASVGSPDWSNIKKMEVRVIYTLASTMYNGTPAYYNIDYITWQDSSTSNKVTGIYEYRKKDGTTKEICCIGTDIYDLSNLNSASKTGMTPGHDYTFVTMNDYLIATNGEDIPQKWDGSTWSNVGSGLPWPDSDDCPPIAKYCCVHKNRLFMAGLKGTSPYYNEKSYLVFGEPGDPSVSNQWPVNNYISVGTDDGDIITGILVYSDVLVIFKQYSTWVLMGSGPFDFALMEIDPHHGCIAPKSIAVGNSGIYYLSHDGVRVFDGNRSTCISDKIRGTFQEKVLKSKMSKAAGAFFSNMYQLWLVEDGGVSEGNYNDMALVFHEPTLAWTIWRAPDGGPYINTFGSFSHHLYCGLTTTPEVCKTFDSYSDNGKAIAAYMTTKEHNLMVPERYKFFHHLYVVTEAETGSYALSVLCETEKESEQRSYYFYLQNPDDNLIENRQTIALRGRYLKLTFSHEGENEPFGLLGYRIGYSGAKVK